MKELLGYYTQQYSGTPKYVIGLRLSGCQLQNCLKQTLGPAVWGSLEDTDPKNCTYIIRQYCTLYKIFSNSSLCGALQSTAGPITRNSECHFFFRSDSRLQTINAHTNCTTVYCLDNIHHAIIQLHVDCNNVRQVLRQYREKTLVVFPYSTTKVTNTPLKQVSQGTLLIMNPSKSVPM